MKIATTDQIREMIRQTIQSYAVPRLLIIENAALGFIEILKSRYIPLNNKRIAVVCGNGSNGGYGLAIARHLFHKHKASVIILLVGKADTFKDDTLAYYKMAHEYKIKIQSAESFNFENCDLIIDAIFGIGFKEHIDEIDESISMLIGKINNSNQPVASVDVPSGLAADTGLFQGAIIKAHLTVTFGLAKYGLLVYPGADFVGELVIVDIGIPDAVINACEINTFTIEAQNVKEWLPPRLNERDTNKGTFGHVLVLAGSIGFSGAPILAAEAAQRSGAGLITLAIPDDLEKEISCRATSVIMTRGLSQSRESSFSAHAVAEALALIQPTTVVALGPGIGLGDEVAEFVFEVVANCTAPLVIDADALTLLAKIDDRGQSIIKNRKNTTILTPHPAELARLLGVTAEAVQNDRLAAIRKAVGLFNCVILLKGSRTLVSDSSGRIYLNMTGNPGLSSGGTGDALTGMVAGFLTQKIEALSAAACAAYVHGLSGDLVASEIGGATGIIATDLIDHFPNAIAQCQQSESV